MKYFCQNYVDIEIIREPEIFIIRNCFDKNKNKEILKEIISNKKHFAPATVSTNNIINKNIRNNISCMYDVLYNYNNQEQKSILLEELYAKFKSVMMHDITFAAKGAIRDFNLTLNSETQVSRYGDDNQKYSWHYDAFGGLGRMVTFVYYVFKEPKKFKGGSICFSDGIIHDGEHIKQKPEPKIIEIQPENNMAVIFSSKMAHCVKPTSSPKNFSDGRFSVNCWMGIKT